MKPKTTISIPPALAEAIEGVKKDRRDERFAGTARLLIMEALEARGVEIREVDPGG